MARCIGRRRGYLIESGPRRPAQRPRIAQIRDNLIDRIAEAEREGRPGEVEGLKISLAGAEDKLAQIGRAQPAHRPRHASPCPARVTGGRQPRLIPQVRLLGSENAG